MTKLAFVDTETTGLHPDRRPWDIALIVREPGRPDIECTWFVDRADLDLGNAEPFGLTVGHFYDRHPQFAAGGNPRDARPARSVLAEVEHLTRGAHLVGAVPNFDAEVLGNRMRAYGIAPSWHYHLIDVETLAVGWIQHKAKTLREARPDLPPLPWPPLPWKSEELSAAIGVKPPADDVRHTAIGDARWARDMYDAIMRPASEHPVPHPSLRGAAAH